MAWPDALRRSRPILTSANSAPGGSSFTHTMDRRAIRPHNRHVPTLSFDDAFAEVKAKVDLVKVVQEYVRLTKRNKDFWGLCPFHQEDSPSFHVNPQRQSWYCFGCERKGDVFTFVELIEKTDKRGALQMLAERAGVELKKVSPEQKERSDLRKRVLDMLKLAARYYEHVLWNSPAGESGRKLLESRRVSEETARKFQLGFAPAGRGFAEYLRAKKRSLLDAQEAGLMRRDGADFFAERLVIPIRDERGQTLAFTARTVRQDEQRKYINSPETPAYIKGRVVYGLDLARDEIARRGHAVVMEGQFDVITAHQFGVANAVASSGTALTDEQVRLLKRFTDELLLVFDSDRAGREATRKAAVLAAGHALRTRVVSVPGAKDPDEYLRGAGPDAAARWEELVAKAPSGFEAGLAGYPSEEQDLIRRAWAAPPPNVDDEVAVELAERIRLEHMKGMHNGIIRELSEAERGLDSEKVVRLEAEARELARAIKDMERRG